MYPKNEFLWVLGVIIFIVIPLINVGIGLWEDSIYPSLQTRDMNDCDKENWLENYYSNQQDDSD